MPRLYDMRSKTAIWGADLSLSFSEMLGWYDGLVVLEASYVGRLQDVAPEYLAKGVEGNVLNMASGRFNVEAKGFSFRFETVAKLNNDIYNPMYDAAKGNATTIDLGYTKGRFSASASFRRQENMTTFIEYRPMGIGGGNTMSYLRVLRTLASSPHSQLSATLHSLTLV